MSHSFTGSYIFLKIKDNEPLFYGFLYFLKIKDNEPLFEIWNLMEFGFKIFLESLCFWVIKNSSSI